MIPEILSMPARIFCHFEPFLLFYPTNNPKNQNFEKLKKMPWDIITLQKCAKNHNHMLYCSSDMACDRCNCYFSFWASFCPFTPRTTQKIKNLQKWKKCLKISSFYTSVPKIMSICYTAPEAWHVTHNCHFFHFGLFFALLTPWQPKNSKLKKTKKLRYIIILHKCTKNHDHMLYCSWDKACGRCKCYFAFWADFCPFTPPW